MKKIHFLSLLWLATTQFTFAALPDSTRSLERCITEGVRTSNALQAKRFTRMASESESEAIRSLQLPSLALRGSYNYTSKTQELGAALPAIPGLPESNLTFGDGNVYDVNAGLTIPLYSGGTLISRQRAAIADESSIRWETVSDSLTLVKQIRRAYFLATGQQANLDAARSHTERLARHLKEIEGSQAIGVASEDARLAVLASLSAAEATVIKAEAATRNARLQLGKFVSDVLLEIYPEDHLQTPILTEENLGSMAASGKPEIKMLDSRILQRNYLSRASSGSLLPSVGASAVYHYAKPGVDAIENEWMDYYTLGISASWVFWDFNEGRSRSRSHKYHAQSLSEARTEMLSALDLRESVAQTLLAAAKPIEEKLRERLVVVERQAVLIGNKLQAGLASESQWLDSQDDLTAAEQEWISAMVALRLAEADYLYAIGR